MIRGIDSQAAHSRGHCIESARKTASWLLHCARRCGSNHWRPETHGDKTGAGKRRPRPPAAPQSQSLNAEVRLASNLFPIRGENIKFVALLGVAIRTEDQLLSVR